MKQYEIPIEVKKIDADKQMVFGWASVATIDGVPVVDKQGDIIPVDELENAAYQYMLTSRDGGDLHIRKGVAKCIESCVLTLEKQEAMGINLGREAWWAGWLVADADTWGRFRDGSYQELSIGGFAVPKLVG